MNQKTIQIPVEGYCSSQEFWVYADLMRRLTGFERIDWFNEHLTHDSFCCFKDSAGNTARLCRDELGSLQIEICGTIDHQIMKKLAWLFSSERQTSTDTRANRQGDKL